MDQLNMNNIKYDEEINVHTQITKNKDLAYYFFSKRQYVRPCKLSRPCGQRQRVISLCLHGGVRSCRSFLPGGELK